MLKRRNRTFKQQATQPPEPKYHRMAEIVRARIQARQHAEAEAEAERSRRAEEEGERKPFANGSADDGGHVVNGSSGSCGASDASALAGGGKAEANGREGSGVVKVERGQAGGGAKPSEAEPEDEVPSEEVIAEMNDEVDGLRKQKSLLYFKLKEILRVEQVGCKNTHSTQLDRPSPQPH